MRKVNGHLDDLDVKYVEVVVPKAMRRGERSATLLECYQLPRRRNSFPPPKVSLPMVNWVSCENKRPNHEI